MNTTILTTLLEVSDTTYARYLVTKDMLYNKINKNDILSIIQQAIYCGKEVAKRTKKDYVTEEFEKYLIFMKVEVEEIKEQGASDFICFGKYTPPNHITVYTGNIEKGESIVSEMKFPSLSTIPFKDVITAHELFHHIETTDKKLFVNNYKIDLWKVFGYTHQSRLTSLSEIAAMSFAKELLQLEYNPTALNVILMYPHQRETAINIYDDIISNR